MSLIQVLALTKSQNRSAFCTRGKRNNQSRLTKDDAAPLGSVVQDSCVASNAYLQLLQHTAGSTVQMVGPGCPTERELACAPHVCDAIRILYRSRAGPCSGERSRSSLVTRRVALDA
jgi:hypothetical protein